jgi:DNA-binding CsgD family transcriptional regulator
VWPTPWYQEGSAVGQVARTVLGHRRQHDRVGEALGDQQRHMERAHHVVAVDLARRQIGRGDFDQARARSRNSAQLCVWLCAKRAASARGAGGARTRAPGGRRRPRPAHSRAQAARQRPPLAAYCRWRQAEALVAAGASRAQASEPLREAYAVATRIGAKPLLRELEVLAKWARLELASPDAWLPDRDQGMHEMLGLTPREAEVLALLARGFTNREIAATLVISARTASVHVSHILRKLGAPNRLEAAAIAHRLSSPT